MAHPLIYEINTRCWLHDLSGRAGRSITLASVPAAEFDEWADLGFSHVWLMGVWTSGPRARAEALKSAELRRCYAEVLPDWQESDVGGSPYAVADYQVPPSLGGEAGLVEFRRQLGQRGMKLVLDFVPNHLGLDHPWVREKPQLFVQAPNGVPDFFEQETRSGVRWLAHGKDPYFPGWTDTVQLDYRVAATRAEMTGLLQGIAARCDGVRCDMAMLVLNEIFARTWGRFPLLDGQAPATDSEFWPAAIGAVRRAQPDFLFVAEAYWGLESRLQALGFDYTYDKVLYDSLVARDGARVQRHLLGLKGAVSAGTHFLENHDEPRIASLVSLAEHRPAALLVLGLPGMRLLHEGQLGGARRKIPVQMVRRLEEPEEPEIKELYRKILATLRGSSVGSGRGEVLEPRAAWAGNRSAEHMVLVQWRDQPPNFELLVVNLAPHRSQCYAPLTVPGLSERNWAMKDLLGDERYERYGEDLQTHGLYLDLSPHGAQLFHFTPAG